MRRSHWLQSSRGHRRTTVVVTAVATVVVLQAGHVLLVAERRGGPLALPGGKLEPGEAARAAAARELREETAIAVQPERLLDLGLRIDAEGGPALTPFGLVDPPHPAGDGDLPRRWRTVERAAATATAPGVHRSIHRALELTASQQRPPPELERWWLARPDDLPWRRTRDPYAVLVCEVMSQQTQIDRVRGRWEHWMARWPTVEALAAAPLAEALRAWDGLGYPRRARALHLAATAIAESGWPPTSRLQDLPGVGRYTADAIRCFAHEQAVLPRDANVRRVLARRFPGGVETGESDPWTLAGALMDVGRVHCQSRPRCGGCPLREGCLVAADGGEWDPAARPRPQSPYPGSLRERRGRLLRAVLAGERPAAASDPRAASSLVADGLVRDREGFLIAP
jgi:A/G-specific adenine glycosylase